MRSEILAGRIRKLQELLSEDALIVEDPLDIYYLTNLSMSLARLVVYKEKICLFVDGRYIEQAQKEAPCDVLPREKLSEFLNEAKTVAFDGGFITYESYSALKANFPDKKWISVSKPLKRLRAIKEEIEIDALRKAARLTWDGFKHTSSLLKEGISEEELSFEFEFFCRRNGASKLSFPPIIAFGENSAYPHYRAGKTKLKKDQIVLFDLGVYVDGYAGDMTRVVFWGKPDPQLERDYLLIQKAQKLAVDAIRPGVRYRDLDRVVRDLLKEERVEHLFVHGLSHGVGLNVHEYPSLRLEGGDPDVVLRPGMVFTVEPGIYRPGLGGVRYEDTVHVTEDGVENFFAELERC